MAFEVIPQRTQHFVGNLHTGMALPELEAAFAQMSVTIDKMHMTVAHACAAIDAALAGDPQ